MRLWVCDRLCPFTVPTMKSTRPSPQLSTWSSTSAFLRTVMVAPFQNSRGEPPTSRHTPDARLQADGMFRAWVMHLTATGSCCPSPPTHLLQDVLQTSSFLSQASLLPCPRSLLGAHGAPGCPGQPCCPHHNMTPARGQARTF